jgi:RasGEF N-terminal motif
MPDHKPVSPEVLATMEKMASDAECLLQLAEDGTVSAGNLEGLVSRVIDTTTDSPGGERFRATFLTIYQLFSTNARLFEILKRRFESANLDPTDIRSQHSYVEHRTPGKVS